MMIEEFDFKKLDISDKKLFCDYFNRFPPLISEFTFTNLFAWRESKKHEYVIIDDHIIISFTENNMRKFYQPIGSDPIKMIKRMISEDDSIVFERVEKSIAERLKKDFKVEEQRDMADYVYSINSLIRLHGRKYEAKRNFVTRFEIYEPSICRLNEDTVNSFLSLQEKWCNLRDCKSNKSLDAENSAIYEALKNFKLFNLQGVCISINGNVEAFAIGEKLNNDTFVEHFEKADTKYTGIYQYLLREFSRLVPKSYLLLNREQDLGIEGIRKTKESYHPVKMIEKFRISKK